MLIFRITFGNPCSRTKTDYYQLSPIRYFLPHQHGKISQIYSVFGTWQLAIYSCGIITSLLFTKPFGKRLKNGTVLDLSFVRKRTTLNIQIKLTNFVKLLNCVSLKSSKNGLCRQWEN